MKKKVVIISILLVLVITFGGVWVWGANNPDVHFGIGKPVGETDVYVEHLGVGSADRFGFIPKTKEKSEQIHEMFTTMSEIHADLVKTAQAPTHLELDITKADDGRTVCTYHGQLTKDGITTDYEESWTFDYKHFGKIEYAG